mgnify:CR=1 FL=1
MEQEKNWLELISETAAYITEKVGEMPKTAIILGTGLGELVKHIDIKVAIPYSEIPNFPVSTVEGYSMKEATFPVRVMNKLGVKTLFVSNAAGGMNPEFRIGDLMIINDHINLFPEHPLRGKNYNELGPRFPSMDEPYSHRLIKKAKEIAAEKNIRLMEGVYVGTQGPTFETPAEYRYFSRIGGDAVGMSTVPEVIVARHMGMEVFGMSVITDLGGEGIEVVKVSHEEVQIAAAKAEPIMSMVMEEIINQFEEL